MHVARVEDRKTIDLIVPRTGGDTADIPACPSGMRQASHEGAILWHVCGRYYRTEDKQQLAEYFQAIVTGDPLTYAPGYNIAPTTIQPVLRFSFQSFSNRSLA
jgi:hypothetical protein